MIVIADIRQYTMRYCHVMQNAVRSGDYGMPDSPAVIRHHLLARTSAALSALLLLIGIGTFAYHRLEHWTWIQSLYFTVATLTTVGYGDLHPTTDASRLFTVCFILAGVGIAIAALGILAGAYFDRRTARIMEQQDTAPPKAKSYQQPPRP